MPLTTAVQFALLNRQGPTRKEISNGAMASMRCTFRSIEVTGLLSHGTINHYYETLSVLFLTR